MTPLTSAPGLISGPKTCPSKLPDKIIIPINVRFIGIKSPQNAKHFQILEFDPCLLQDKYLGGYAGGARNAFSTMENAMAECLRGNNIFHYLHKTNFLMSYHLLT